MQIKDSFPNLSLFCETDWVALTQEYEKTSPFVTFPEYLELKCESGDCPQHIYELAYFDSALMGLQEGEFFFPEEDGLHLNPSAHFLSFDYDIFQMVCGAQEGKIEILPRQNVLCLFVSEDGEIKFHELSKDELKILQLIEENKEVPQSTQRKHLEEIGLIFDNRNAAI